MLGETVGWRRWCAVLVGFLGVLVMLRPGVAPIGAGSLAALGAACASACAILLVRKLSTTETTTSIAFYSNLVAVLLMAPAAARRSSCRPRSTSRSWPPPAWSAAARCWS